MVKCHNNIAAIVWRYCTPTCFTNNFISWISSQQKKKTSDLNRKCWEASITPRLFHRTLNLESNKRHWAHITSTACCPSACEPCRVSFSAPPRAFISIKVSQGSAKPCTPLSVWMTLSPAAVKELQGRWVLHSVSPHYDFSLYYCNNFNCSYCNYYCCFYNFDYTIIAMTTVADPTSTNIITASVTTSTAAAITATAETNTQDCSHLGCNFIYTHRKQRNIPIDEIHRPKTTTTTSTTAVTKITITECCTTNTAITILRLWIMLQQCRTSTVVLWFMLMLEIPLPYTTMTMNVLLLFMLLLLVAANTVTANSATILILALPWLLQVQLQLVLHLMPLIVIMILPWKHATFAANTPAAAKNHNCSASGSKCLKWKQWAFF